jgi:hypothetical protein
MRSIPAKINVEHHAEGGDGTEKAQEHIESALHIQRPVNANGASNQTTQDGESHHRIAAITAFCRRGLIICLCSGSHKLSPMRLKRPAEQPNHAGRRMSILAYW